MRRYAVLEVDLLRGKIIRRNVCTAVALHTRRSCPTSTALIMKELLFGATQAINVSVFANNHNLYIPIYFGNGGGTDVYRK